MAVQTNQSDPFLAFLDQSKVLGEGPYNVRAIDGQPFPGKWWIKEGWYQQFFRQVGKRELSFVESIPENSKIYFELKVDHELSNEEFLDLYHVLKGLLENPPDDLELFVKRREPDEFFYYHLIVPNYGMRLGIQKELAIRFKAIRPYVDTDHEGRGSLMIGSHVIAGTKKIMRAHVLITKTGLISIVGWNPFKLLERASMLWVPGKTLKIIPTVIEPLVPTGPLEPMEVDELDPFIQELKKKTEERLKCEVIRTKMLDEGVRFILGSPYCEIAKKPHRDGNRAVTIGKDGCFYTCLQEDCKKIGTWKVDKPCIVPINVLKGHWKKRKREKNPDDIDLTATQELVQFMYGLCKENNYYRFEEYVYSPLVNSKGQKTIAYEKVCSVKKLILDNSAEDVNYVQWVNRTRAEGNERVCIREMCITTTKSTRFPLIDPTYSCYSFENGYVYGNPKTLTVTFTRYPCEPTNLVACMHFPFDFDEEEFKKPWDQRFYEIDSTLGFQDIPKQAIRDFHMFAGRFSFEVGQLEKLGKNIVCCGESNCGKSSVGYYIANKAPSSKVARPANNVQEKYSFSDHLGCRICVLDDVKPVGSGWGVDEAELNKLTTGQETTHNRKYKSVLKGEDAKWLAHFVINSNYVGLFDNKGSCAERRSLLLLFIKSIVNPVDEAVFIDRMYRNCAVSIAGDMQAYFEMLRKLKGVWKDKNVFDCLDPYFNRSTQTLKSETNPLAAWILNCEGLKIMDGITKATPATESCTTFVPLGLMREKFNTWKNNSDFSKATFKWTVTEYTNTLGSLGLIVKDVTRTYPRSGLGEKKARMYVFGADFP